MSISHNALLAILFGAFLTSCDRKTMPPHATVVLTQNDQGEQIHFSSSTDSNNIRVSGLAEIVEGRARATEWRVPRSMLDKQARWDGFSPDLALTPQRAIAIAFPQVKHNFPEIHDWVVESVQLRNLLATENHQPEFSFPGVWLYEVKFAPKDRSIREMFNLDRGAAPLIQMVLLDGTIVPSKGLPCESK